MTTCPCGPTSTVGGLPECHPAGDCTATGMGDGLLCRPCAQRVWDILDARFADIPEPHERRKGQNRPPDPERQKRMSEAIAYIGTYTGTFGLILDLRADRAWGSKWFHLSDAQLDAVLRSKEREAAWAAEREERQREVAKVATLTDGLYRDPEGTVYKVQKAVHGSGNLYAKRLTIDPSTKSGTFEYEPGAVRRIDPSWRMTLEDALAFGALYGCCCACGRTLTDEKSIEAGIGPVCRRKFA